MDKDAIEHEILSCIFDQGNQCQITKTEQPDFILEYQGNLIGKVRVGVEITQLYFDNTSARLKNMPRYVKDLIESNKFAHKDDKKNLEVKEVKYFSQSSPEMPFDVKMLFLPSYTVNHYRNALLQAIRKKTNKYKNYNSSVNQSALIIYDHEDFFNTFKREDFIRVLFDSSVIEAIRESPFEEVYLITRFNNDHREYYVQLKFCLLQNELSVFLEYVTNNNLVNKIGNHNLTLYDVFSEILVKKGYFPVMQSERNKMPVVNCNRYSFYFDSENKRMSVFDDFPKLIKDGTYSHDIKNRNFFTKKSFNQYIKETKNRFVSFDVGFKVLKNKRPVKVEMGEDD